MTVVESLLASRATFVLAALAVSWIAVVLLALVVANLHFRLAHLERTLAPAEESRKPFGHLLGRSLDEALGPELSAGIRTLFVLSSDCPSCERVLDRLRAVAGEARFAILWRDGTPSPLPALPEAAVVVDDGPAVSRELGVRVTPFAVSADTDGRIVRAAPIGSVDSLALWLEGGDEDAGRIPKTTPQLPHHSLKGVST